MAVYLWVLPTAHTIALRNVVFFSLTLLTLWSVWRYGLRLHLPLATPWLVFSAVSLASLIYALDPAFSAGEIKKEVGYGILVLLLAASWVRNIESLERLIIILILGNILLICSVLFKIIILDPFWHHPLSQISSLLYGGQGKSLYNGVGNFSTYLITVMPLIAAFAFSLPPHRRTTRLSLFALLAFNLLALFLTGNRAGLVICVAQILFCAGFLIARGGFVSWRTLITAAIVLAVVGALTWGQMNVRTPVDNDIRWKMWAWIINDIKANPLSGGGFGRTVLCRYDPGFCQALPFEHAHNMLLDKGVQMGIPGIAAFLFLFGATLRALWPSREADSRHWGYLLGAATMAIGVFLKNMTDDFFVEHNAQLFWVLTGAVLGTLAGQRTPAKAENR